jgi:release factor glutamine methyltransferase
MKSSEALPDSHTPDLDVRLLREHAGADEALFQQLIARRRMGEPIAQIVGTKGFWTLDLAVTCDVLTPRPDSETMIDALLALRPDRSAPLRILDLGTGSGCLILAALSEYPNARGDAVDISTEALHVARGNAERVGVASRSEFFHGSWCDALPDARCYDVILSNPPYIPDSDIASLAPDVRVFEPHLALAGGEDGLDCYRMLAKQLYSRMVSCSIALLEVGAGQSVEVAAIMHQSGLDVITTRRDLAGIERVVGVRKN